MLAVRAAASAIVIATAADQNDDEQDNPGAVTVTKEVISTHERFLLFSDFTIYYENPLNLVTSTILNYNTAKNKENSQKRENTRCILNNYKNITEF